LPHYIYFHTDGGGDVPRRKNIPDDAAGCKQLLFYFSQPTDPVANKNFECRRSRDKVFCILLREAPRLTVMPDTAALYQVIEDDVDKEWISSAPLSELARSLTGIIPSAA